MKQGFSQKVVKKEKSKLKLQRDGKYNALSGFAVFGIVGWSVVVPTLSGIALGVWLDKKYAQPFSWTISFLFIGLFTGCIIAWKWIDKENKKMHQNKNKNE